MVESPFMLDSTEDQLVGSWRVRQMPQRMRSRTAAVQGTQQVPRTCCRRCSGLASAGPGVASLYLLPAARAAL